MKLFLVLKLNKFSNTAFISLRGTSLDERPYLPPNTLIFLSFNALTISKYNGSPKLPASLVLSRTAILETVLGSTVSKYLVLNGLY